MSEPSNVNNGHQFFESIKEINDQGNEHWYARALSKILDYAEFRNFLPVIKKAQTACEKSGQNINNHFVQVHEMVNNNDSLRYQIGTSKSRGGKCYLPYEWLTFSKWGYLLITQKEFCYDN